MASSCRIKNFTIHKTSIDDESYWRYDDTSVHQMNRLKLINVTFKVLYPLGKKTNIRNMVNAAGMIKKNLCDTVLHHFSEQV